MFTKLMHATIYIFRHGDTYQTKNKLPYKEQAISAPIIPEAKNYLEEIGRYLRKKNVVYTASSSFLRCRQSVEIVEKQMKTIFAVDERLNEYDPVYLPGESEGQFRNRIQSFLLEMQEKHFSSIAICTHGCGISLIKHQLVRPTFPWDNLDYPAPGVLLAIKKGKTFVHDFRERKT